MLLLDLDFLQRQLLLVEEMPFCNWDIQGCNKIKEYKAMKTHQPTAPTNSTITSYAMPSALLPRGSQRDDAPASCEIILTYFKIFNV